MAMRETIYSVTDAKGKEVFGTVIEAPHTFEEYDVVFHKYAADENFRRAIVRTILAQRYEEVKRAQKCYPDGFTITTISNGSARR